MEGNTFYSIREKELFKFLSNNFTQKTEVNWKEEFVPNFFDFNNVELTYIKDDSWFFRYELNPNEIYYFFGIKRDEDIFLRLIIKSSAESKSSVLKFFKSGKVLIYLKIKDNNPTIHDYLRDNFDLKRNKKHKTDFYIPLGDSISFDITDTIVRLLNSVECKFDTNLNYLYVTGLINNENVITQKEKEFVFKEFGNELNSYESFLPDEDILNFESRYSNNYFNFYKEFNFNTRIVNKNKEFIINEFNQELDRFDDFISEDDKLNLESKYNKFYFPFYDKYNFNQKINEKNNEIILKQFEKELNSINYMIESSDQSKLEKKYTINGLNYYNELNFEELITKHNGNLILNEFNEMLRNRTTFITNSEKIKFRKEYNEDYLNFYDELKFEKLINDFNNDLARREIESYLESYDGIISIDDKLSSIIKLKDLDLDTSSYFEMIDEHNKKIIDEEKEILLSEFKDMLRNRTTFITDSDKIKFRKEYNKDYFNFYDNLNFEELINDFNDILDNVYANSPSKGKIFQFDNHEISIDEIIAKIDCDVFQSEPREYNELINELNDIIESPIFNIIAEDFEEDEISQLIIKIKKDINEQKISGDIQDIIDFYLDEFNKIKKMYSLNSFLNDYIKSDDFRKLLELYDEYTENMILEIINHVRKDIFDDDLMDNEKIKLKLSYYFKAETNKNDNYIRLKKIKLDSYYYMGKYNLNKNEFMEICEFIKVKVQEGYHIKNVDSYVIRKIKEKVDECRNDSRLKLKRLLTDQEFIEKNEISQEQIEYLNENIGDLIYKNAIRSNQITENFIIENILEL